jgi:hypothetical protein
MIAESTKKKYEMRLKKLEKLGVEINDQLTVNELINTLEEAGNQDGSIRNYLSSIKWYLTEIGKYDKLNEAITKEIKSSSERTNKIEKKNVLRGSQINNYVEWPEIMKVFEKVKVNYEQNKEAKNIAYFHQDELLIIRKCVLLQQRQMPKMKQ